MEKKENRGEKNVAKKTFLNVSFATSGRDHVNEKVYSSKSLAPYAFTMKSCN